MPQKFYKHKLLLDEGFYYRKDLPITNSRFDVKHIAGDYKQKALPDLKVFKLAKRKVSQVIEAVFGKGKLPGNGRRYRQYKHQTAKH